VKPVTPDKSASSAVLWSLPSKRATRCASCRWFALELPAAQPSCGLGDQPGLPGTQPDQVSLKRQRDVGAWLHSWSGGRRGTSPSAWRWRSASSWVVRLMTRGDSAGRLRVVSGSRAARCGVPAVAQTAAVSVVLESPTTLVRLDRGYESLRPGWPQVPRTATDGPARPAASRRISWPRRSNASSRIRARSSVVKTPLTPEIVASFIPCLRPSL
jgi:hypothetical protein